MITAEKTVDRNKSTSNPKLALNRKLAELVEAVKPHEVKLGEDFKVYSAQIFGQEEGENMVRGLFQIKDKFQES